MTIISYRVISIVLKVVYLTNFKGVAGLKVLQN